MLKKIIIVISILIFWVWPSAYARNYKVAVFDFDDRLDQTQTTAKYIEKQLLKKLQGLRLDQYSGEKSVPVSIDLLRKIDNGGYDLLIIITSDALIIANHVIRKTPTLFTNANNPLFLGLNTLGPPGGAISGASYYISVEKQLALYLKLLPELKKAGFIFDRNNKSTKVELPEVRNVCQKIGLTYDIDVVADDVALMNAVSRLIKEDIQALIIGSSDMLYNNISGFLDTCNKAKVPIFSFNKKGVQQGALAALSSDYNLMVDNLILPMALLVLEKGMRPGDMPVAFLKENRIFINMHQAKILDLVIPEDILEKAIVVP